MKEFILDGSYINENKEKELQNNELQNEQPDLIQHAEQNVALENRNNENAAVTVSINEPEQDNLVIKEEMVEETAEEMAEEKMVEEIETSDDIKELRTEYVKQYKNNNNTYSAVIYSEPVHYLNDKNQFSEINNELVFKKFTKKFENKKNSFKVSFEEDLKTNDIFTIEKGVYKATLALSENLLGENISSEKNNKSKIFNSKAIKTDAVAKLEAKKHNFSQKASKLVYENFKNNADIEYNVLSGKVKENIIIKEKSAAYEFDFDLKLDKLEIKLSEDKKSLELFAADTGELVFTIPAPFMFDAENKFSSKVVFNVAEKAENIYSFKIIPDAEWINAKERKFPVVVDPQIVSSNASIITVKSYAGSNEADAASATKFAGSYNGQKTVKINLNLTEILTKALEKNSKVLNATLELTKVICTNSNNGFEVKCGNKTIDFLKPTDKNLKLCIDVTEQFNNLKTSGGNLAIEISAKVLGSDYIGIASELITEDYSKPVIYVDYVSEKINAKNQTYHTTDVKRAGAGSVNLFSGNLNFTHSDVSTDSSVMPVGISHIYNGFNVGKKNSCEQYLNSEQALTQNYHTGKGWKLNLHQNLIKKPKPENDLFKYIGDVYTYIDASGNYHDFTERYYYKQFDEKKYIEKNQITIGYDGKLTYSSNEIKPEIKTTSGLELIYSLDGFKNSDKIEKRAEDVVKLSDEVEQLERGIKQLNLAKEGNPLSKTYYEDLMTASTVEKDKTRYSHEIKKIDEIEIPNTAADLVKYQNKLDEKRYQLNRLIEMTPVDFIKDESENVLGFEKNGKLVMLSDKYENQIFIEYENDKIIKVYDGEEKVTELTYENDLLAKITAPDGNVTAFDYIAEQLKFINYPDGSRTTFEYDDNNRLTEIIEPSGYGVRYSYNANSKVIKTQEISLTSNISKRGLVESCCTQAGEIYCCSGNTCFSGEFDFIDKYEEGSFVDISYNGFNTLVTNKKGIKTGYIFDIAGRKVTAYEMPQTEITASKSVAFDYNNDKRAFTISPYNTAAIQTIAPFTLTGNPSAEVVKSAANLSLSALPNGLTDFILSGWVKADSAYINPNRVTNFSKSLIDQKHIDSFDENKSKRKFELRAEVCYTLDGSDKDEFYCSFDFHNVDWQYTAFPVTLRKDETPVKIEIIADYSYNINTAEFKNIKLDEGVWEYSEFDNEGNVIHTLNSENSESFIEYNEKNKPVEIKIKKGERYFYTKYNYNAKGDLIRTIDYNGLVNENVYDDKGRIIKTVVYNLSDPTSKLYSEKEYAKNGQVLADVDPRGEENGETLKTNYDYVNGTNIISGVKSPKGNRTAYGYDIRNGNLKSLSGMSNGEDNINLYTHTMGLTTSLSHNGTSYDYEYDGFLRTTKISVAGSAYLENVYTDGGLNANDTAEVKLNSGESFKTEYDKYGKALKVSYKKGVNGYADLVENQYDENEKLKTVIDKSGTMVYNTSYTYDKKGNVLSSKSWTVNPNTPEQKIDNVYEDNKLKTSSVTIGTATKTYAYEYDDKPESNLVSLSLPNGLEQKTTYDGLGRVVEQALDNKFSSNIYYLKNGDHATNMVSSIWYGLNGVIKDNLKYSYDKNGNIEKVFENGQFKVKYSYDELDRLIREDNKGLLLTTTYTYDAGGNIKNKTIYEFTLDGDLTEKEGSPFEYEYKVSGWKDQLTKYGSYSITYDTLGNPLTYKGKTLDWERGRNLIKYNDVMFKYNADGIRTSKTKGSVTTKYYYNGSSLIKEERSDGTNLWYTYGSDGITGVNHNGTEYIFKKNLQGDVTAIYNTAGVLQAKYTYDAWGACYPSNIAGSIGTINPFRYRGYYWDSDISLYYLMSRYYDSEIGRFINADDISELDPETINGLNLYAFCGNNPIMHMDPLGNKWWHWLVAVVVAVVVVAAVVATAGLAAAALGATAAVANGMIAGAAIGGAIGAGIGISNAYNSGGDGWNLVGGAALGGLVGGVAGGLIGGAIGGIISAGPAIGSFMSQPLFTLGGSAMSGGAAVMAGGITVTVGNAIGLLAALGLVFMGNPYTKNPNDPSDPHETTKNGKSGWDKHSGKRSGGPEKGDARRPYKKGQTTRVIPKIIVPFIGWLLSLFNKE